jgi:hypothetical protein
MDVTVQLIAAVAALWGVLTAVVTAAFRFLLDERKTMREDWRKEREGYDLKLDVAGQVIVRQNDSMQKQLDAQSALVSHQQTMIEALQSLTRVSSE